MLKNNLSEFIPPFHCGNKSYIESLSELLKKYVEYVRNHISADSYIINKIENVSCSILSAIDNLKKANAQEAYNLICKIITDEKDNIDWPTYFLDVNIPLIRLRYSEIDLLYRNDIFHIPYSQRHKVSQQRFSITGVPCLYLSGCAFTAWLELNKPNFSNLWCSGFRAKKEIKVLDLAIRLDSIVKEENNTSKLIFYPFVIATSFSTKFPQYPFKEEYIISNILLQAIINNTEIKGIRYFSTRVFNYKQEYAWMAANIVLPARQFSDSEYDKELSSIFVLTFPQPCSTLLHSPNIGDVSCYGMGISEFDKRSNVFEGINHYEPQVFENYPVTQFFNIDGYIRTYLAYSMIEN